MTADIDLDPNSPGARVFKQAVIAPGIISCEGIPRRCLFEGNIFSGFFDGSGHVISNLTIEGQEATALFGGLSFEACVANLRLVQTRVIGTAYVGMIAAWNKGFISSCRSSGSVIGDKYVGGGLGLTTRATSHHAIAPVLLPEKAALVVLRE